MINVLPIKNKIAIKREYLKRLLIVFGIFSFIVFFIAIIFSALIFFLVNKEKKNSAEYLSLVEKHSTLSDGEGISSFISEINSKVKIYEENKRTGRIINEVVKKIIEVKPAGIKINSFSFKKNNISFAGISETRSELIYFSDKLKNSGEFKKINSPLSNFLKEKNIEFNISIELYEK